MTRPATPLRCFLPPRRADPAAVRLCRAHPNLVSVAAIGKSFEGREIWGATLTNSATSVDTDKPAFWCDGNIHAAKLTTSAAVLYYLHQFVTI